MQQWGFIKCFRFDNGRPLGDPKRQVIPPAALNIIAFGCQVLYNPPRSPTKNAKVERNQGTTGKWADANRCANIEEFKRSLKYAVLAQRELYPTRTCQGSTRAEHYPELVKNPKKFDASDFDQQRIYRFLQKGLWFRTLNPSGQVKMFAKSYTVGYQFRKQDVSVKLAIYDKQPFWLCYNEQQQLIAKILAKNLADGSYYDLSNMSKNSDR